MASLMPSIFFPNDAEQILKVEEIFYIAGTGIIQAGVLYLIFKVWKIDDNPELNEKISSLESKIDQLLKQQE